MFSRLFWRLVTPRQLRRGSLIILLAWLGVALAYQNGLIPQPDASQLPIPVQIDPAGP